ncbi:MAG: N-acetylmuramoyl-L-alanine amidase [Gammaproteobacteria bacterium]|nr:N-acetylmuramoyl-L-alanine amidase [Gammaproteobacteria bacterium]
MATTASAGEVVKFETMRLGQEPGRINLVLDLSGAPQFKFFTLNEPDRFVVDLVDVQRTGKKSVVDFNGTPIKGVRTAPRNDRDLRLVVDLAQSTVKARAYLLPPAGNDGHRLVIEFTNVEETKKMAPVAAKSVPVPVIAKTALLVPEPAAPVKQEPAKQAPVVTEKEVFATAPLRDIVVAIDAGHGGVDPGAIGDSGTYEKEVVLAVAKRLEALVVKEKGMRPVLTRDGDYFVTLRNRMDKARAANADIFISIHADSFPDKRAQGASVYTLSQKGATTEAAHLLANRENAADLVGGVSLDDKDAMLASVLLDLSQSATIEASLDAAGRVLKGLDDLGKIRRRRVEQAGFVVLKSPDVPSMLVETAFISNPTEEKNLKSPEYQQQLAEAILDGIRSYFKDYPPPGTHFAAREHIIKQGDTLAAIAEQYNISVKSLRAVNKLHGDAVRAGQVLHIPRNVTSGS